MVHRNAMVLVALVIGLGVAARKGAGSLEISGLVGPVAADRRHPMGPEQAARTRPAGAADAGIPGHVRGQPGRPGGRRARQRSALHLHPARHAAGHDRDLSDGDRDHAEDHLHPDREPAGPRRIYTDGRDWPTESRADLRGLLDRPLDRRGRGRPLRSRSRSRPATSRARAPSTPAACRCTRTTRPSSRSASISTRPTRTCCTTRSPPSIMR